MPPTGERDDSMTSQSMTPFVLYYNQVMEDLFEAAEGRTSLLIAHRLSTVRHADLIVVLDKGRVVEQGAHNDLVARPGGKYAELWAMQHSENDDGGDGGFQK
jgi:subfamily B ATP-binding cassette protein MsbA